MKNVQLVGNEEKNNQSKKQNPFYSFIIATYNSAAYLENCIDSIVNQTFKSCEIIIIDGKSTDATMDIVKKWKGQIKYSISEVDEGIYDAWNKGLKVCSGEWVCFIGSDDLIYNEKVLEDFYPHLKSADREHINYVYGKVKHVREHSLNEIETVGSNWDEVCRKIRDTMSLMHAGSFQHKSLFNNTSNFNKEFKIAGDYEFILRIFLQNNLRGKFLEDNVSVIMRNGGISGTLSNRLKLVNELQLARKINGIKSISWDLIQWKIRVLVFLFLQRIIGTGNSYKLADLYRKLKGKSSRWSLK